MWVLLTGLAEGECWLPQSFFRINNQIIDRSGVPSEGCTSLRKSLGDKGTAYGGESFGKRLVPRFMVRASDVSSLTGTREEQKGSSTAPEMVLRGVCVWDSLQCWM